MTFLFLAARELIEIEIQMLCVCTVGSFSCLLVKCAF